MSTRDPAEHRTMLAAPLPGALRRTERLLFLLLAVFIWPFIAVGVVATWGLIVWIYHMLVGPPGPP